MLQARSPLGVPDERSSNTSSFQVYIGVWHALGVTVWTDVKDVACGGVGNEAKGPGS